MWQPQEKNWSFLSAHFFHEINAFLKIQVYLNLWPRNKWQRFNVWLLELHNYICLLIIIKIKHLRLQVFNDEAEIFTFIITPHVQSDPSGNGFSHLYIITRAPKLRVETERNYRLQQKSRRKGKLKRHFNV